MSIKISDVACPYSLMPWSRNPGAWIVNQAGSNSKKAEAAFRSFVQHKVPEAVTILIKLIDARHISSVHLPMTVYTIFLIYVDEQIELYQSQQNEKDSEVENKWREFKEMFSRKRNEIFTRDSAWATSFFDQLKSRLLSADALSADFEATISSWLQLISIANIGDMVLINLFEKQAKTTVLKDSGSKNLLSVDLPRSDLERSFYLLLRLLSQESKWIIPKMEQHLPCFRNATPQLVEVFDEVTQKPLKEASDMISTMGMEVKRFLQDLFLLKLTDNEKLAQMRSGLLAHSERVFRCFGDVSSHIEKLRSQYEQGIAFEVIPKRSGGTIPFTRECAEPFLQILENYRECDQLIQAGLEVVLGYDGMIDCLLKALEKSNEAFKKFQGEGTPLRLASACSSILPKPRVYDERVFEELCASSSPRSGGGRRKKVKKSSHQPIEKKAKEKSISQPVSEKKTNEKSKQVSLEPQTPPQHPAVDPFEQLRERMIHIHQENLSSSLRQALWHLDALISIQQLLDTKSVKAEESLTVFDAAVSSAQKLLEQTYRFCGSSSQTTHNLKVCHSACSASPYPEIVKELYLANHWTRYFYIEQQTLHSISTQQVEMPPLLEELVKLAEGAPFSPQELQQRVKTLIEKTCQQVEQLLPQTAVSPLDPPLAKEVAIQWKTLIDTAGMETVKSHLKAFLADAGFAPQQPVYLHVKQAIAALTMCKDSLARIQAVRTPRELATWTSWCLQQVQEGIENVLHAIEYLQEGEASVQHDLKALSEKVGLKMGNLAGACNALSYKPRYPVENSSEGLGAQIIDDVEAFKHHPECLEGFQIVGSSPFLWKMPSQGLSLDQMGARLESLIKQAEAFLRTQAVPALSI